MRNPAYGKWVGRDGDTPAPRPTHIGGTAPRISPPTPPCPACGAPVQWETDGRGEVVALDGRRVHVCELSPILARHDHEDGAEVLALLRRAMNERRVYGEAV